MGEVTQVHAMCFNSFARLISAIEHPVRDFSDQVSRSDVEEEFDRYKLWAGSVGAARPCDSYNMYMSLDDHLRKAPFYKIQVLKLLGVLDNTVQKATLLVRGKRKPFEELSPDEETDGSKEEPDESEAEDSPWEISSSSSVGSGRGDRPGHIYREDNSFGVRLLATKTQQPSPILVQKPIGEMARLLQSIKSTISCLYQMQMPIRNPDPLDWFKRNPPTDESPRHQLDILYVRNMFPEIDPEVATRLGKAISRRREEFFHRLSRRRGPQIRNISPETVTETPPTAEQATREVTTGEINQIRAAGNGNILHTGAMALRTTAKTIRINTPEVETSQALRAPAAAGSVSSEASSYANRSPRIEVPPCPKGDNGGGLETFECPYCLESLTIETGNAWRKLIPGDPQPHARTPRCDPSEPPSVSQEEWYKHPTQRHRADSTKWFGGVTGHEQDVGRAGFLAHMSQDHDTTFKDSQLTLLPNMFQSQKSQGGDCNLCERFSEKLKSHVSCHLHQIVEFSLLRVDGTRELNSHSSREESSLAGVNRLLDGPRKPQSSISAPAIEPSEPTHTQEPHTEGPEICDPVDQVTVPDTMDFPLWGMGRTINQSSDAKGDPQLVLDMSRECPTCALEQPVRERPENTEYSREDCSAMCRECLGAESAGDAMVRAEGSTMPLGKAMSSG